ncbi:DUF4259 domain-containing protein [Corynebacterium sp. 32222D000AT]|nr:DUF4259 domain-containing protein [Mycobacteriaceae bacterium]MDY5830202.1 DUF4259 domain-containing protein [Corynebacterium sp.]
MSTWDEEIFTRDSNTDFLDELSALEEEEVVEAVRDAVVLAADSAQPTDEELANGLAAATIAAIWSGAPFSAGDVVAEYPFIRSLAGSSDEQLNEKAAELLETAEPGEAGDADIEPFLEALA